VKLNFTINLTYTHPIEHWEEGAGDADCLDRSDEVLDAFYISFSFQDPTFHSVAEPGFRSRGGLRPHPQKKFFGPRLQSDLSPLIQCGILNYFFWCVCFSPAKGLTNK
jgi:hypothetical protein